MIIGVFSTFLVRKIKIKAVRELGMEWTRQIVKIVVIWSSRAFLVCPASTKTPLKLLKVSNFNKTL